MNDQELNKRLAELLDWNDVAMAQIELWGVDPDGLYSPLPDWPNDLNACHAVVLGLTRKQRDTYSRQLKHIVAIYNSQFHGPDDPSIPDHEATAKQRTQALIKTLEEP